MGLTQLLKQIDGNYFDVQDKLRLQIDWTYIGSWFFIIRTFLQFTKFSNKGFIIRKKLTIKNFQLLIFPEAHLHHYTISPTHASARFDIDTFKTIAAFNETKLLIFVVIIKN